MKTLLITVTLALIAPATALACPGCNEKDPTHARAAAAPQSPLAPGQARVTIPVTGMHCGHCASRVEAALTQVDGVKTAAADLEQARAVVTVEKGKVDPAKLAAAIDAAGFKAGKPVEN